MKGYSYAKKRTQLVKETSNLIRSEIILEKKPLNCSVSCTCKAKMNIIINIDEDRYLLGHSIEITCTEFELLV